MSLFRLASGDQRGCLEGAARKFACIDCEVETYVIVA